MPNKVFVSPGVYTSEKDLSFVTSQIGVTTLGLVGETTIGPAFQPIFIDSYDNFRKFFGGLNATKVKDNNAPLYELPYIAKEYLSQSNQLFVTRVLGLSGFEAGQAWGITLDAALDESTTAATTTTTYNAATPLIRFTATSANTNVTIVSNDPLLQQIINSGDLDDTLATISQGPTGSTYDVTGNIKTSGTFSGLTTTMYLNNLTAVGAFITGTTTGITVHYSGTGYSDAEDKLVIIR